MGDAPKLLESSGDGSYSHGGHGRNHRLGLARRPPDSRDGGSRRAAADGGKKSNDTGALVALAPRPSLALRNEVHLIVAGEERLGVDVRVVGLAHTEVHGVAARPDHVTLCDVIAAMHGDRAEVRIARAQAVCV